MVTIFCGLHFRGVKLSWVRVAHCNYCSCLFVCTNFCGCSLPTEISPQWKFPHLRYLLRQRKIVTNAVEWVPFSNAWQDILDPFSSFPAEYGDLFLDIADAYTDNGKHILCWVDVVYWVCMLVEEHSKALPLLSSLIHTESFNQAGMWLKHAECLHALNELEQAAMSYAQVTLTQAMHFHYSSRHTVSCVFVRRCCA